MAIGNGRFAALRLASAGGVYTLGLKFDTDTGVAGEQLMHLSLEEGSSEMFP